MNAKRIELFVIIVIIAVIGVAFALTRAPSRPQADLTIDRTEIQEAPAVQQAPASTISYQGVEGHTALELLKEAHSVETQDFGGLGEFVLSIDGIEPANTHFWAFYANGQKAQVGAGQYQTKNGERIEWKLEKIGDY
ncbi:MAG: DUF4430 domain-containing protein [Candidatus Doudnabacteria bacterium]|nr:DUF4430 domain-containing protein [Candidatus Doudnabacteria bacterium]